MISSKQGCHAHALDIRLKQLGPDHRKVGETYENIGDIHNHQSHIDQAKRYYDLAVAIYFENLRPEHFKVRDVQNKLKKHQQNCRTAHVDVDTRFCLVACTIV